jgi:GTP-sensing pleiotropic transcriptional regulator CodY
VATKRQNERKVNMTNREFYKAVINANISKEMSDFAQGEIEKLDAKNEKRKNTQTKAQKENEGIKSQIVECLTENGAMVASVIAEKVGISTQKASALCKLLVEEKVITVADIKVKNKGTLKQYAVVVADTESDSE